eukprot:m.110681 g.110681  ORF g.110681 m.110681 type:complete len:1105 (-) comp9227_c0_seq5:2296-5610(-)
MSLVNSGKIYGEKKHDAHGEGQTYIRYDVDGQIVTGGGNGMVYLFKDGESESVASELVSMDGAVLSMDCKEKGVVASNGENIYFRAIDSDSDATLLRAEADGGIDVVALNNDGNICAFSLQNEIKLIPTENSRIVRHVGGHSKIIHNLCFSRSSRYLASTSFGELKLWDLHSEPPMLVETRTLDFSFTSLDLNPEVHGNGGMEFDPKGEFLAVPVKNTIQIFDTTLNKKFLLKDMGHSAVVSECRFDSKGTSLASVDVSGKIIVWELSLATNNWNAVVTFTHPHHKFISSIAWCPTRDEIGFADVFGRFCVWDKPVPDEYKQKPLPPPQQQQQSGTNGIAPTPATSSPTETPAQVKVEDGASSNNVNVMRTHTGTIVDSEDEEEEEDDGNIMTSEPFIEEEIHDTHASILPTAQFATSFAQPPFQPSSTPEEDARRFLVWNDDGCIISREEDTLFAVDVEFHNKSLHHPARINDHFGYTMGALTTTFFSLACPAHEPSEFDKRNHPSILFGRNTHNSHDQWSIFFPKGEEIQCIAVGTGEATYVAAATSRNYVRIYSNFGIVKGLFCLAGPVVTMAAREDSLLVIHHSGAGVQGGQSLVGSVYNVSTQKLVVRMDIPLTTPSSTITWAGFSENGAPIVADSDNIVKMLVSDWGSSWVPILDLNAWRDADEKRKHDSYWITGVTNDELLCIICRGGEAYPQVLPRPITSSIPLCVPIVGFEESQIPEELAFRSKLQLNQVIEIEGLDELDKEDRSIITQLKRKIDEHTLRCLARAITNDKSGRAIELTTNLMVTESYRDAVKIANKSKKAQFLVDRLLGIGADFEDQERKRLRALLGAKRGYNTIPRRVAYPTPPTTPYRVSTNQNTSLEEANQQHAHEPHTPASSRSTVSVAGLIASSEKKASKIPATATQHTSSSTPRSTPKHNPFAKKKDNTLEQEESLDDSESVKKSHQNLLAALDDAAKPSPTKTKSKFSAKVPSSSPAATLMSTPQKKKKALSGYLKWLTENRASISAQFPGLQPKEIVKKAGEIWKGMAAEEKAKYSQKRQIVNSENEEPVEKKAKVSNELDKFKKHDTAEEEEEDDEKEYGDDDGDDDNDENVEDDN